MENKSTAKEKDPPYIQVVQPELRRKMDSYITVVPKSTETEVEECTTSRRPFWLIALSNLLYIAVIGIVLFIFLPKLMSSIQYSDREEKPLEITFRTLDDLDAPEEEDIKELENAYNKVYAYFDGIDDLKAEMLDLYNQVESAKVCSIVNRNFNTLEEKYEDYYKHLDNIQYYLSICEEQYNKILKSLDNIPAYLALHNEMEEKFQNIIGPLHESAIADQEKYLGYSQEAENLYNQAKKRADDFFNEYYDLMCHIVMAESGGCSAFEQYCVANVIENRIKHYKFPNTIYAVIYSPGQYAPVMNGSINKTPTQSVKRNVEEYLRGRVETGMPDNVVYQALFPQGHGRWNDSTVHYFCYY